MMNIEGIVKECTTYANKVTTFKFVDDESKRLYYYPQELVIVNGQYIKAKTAITEPRLEDIKLRVVELDVYSRKDGELLHQYVPKEFYR